MFGTRLENRVVLVTFQRAKTLGPGWKDHKMNLKNTSRTEPTLPQNLDKAIVTIHLYTLFSIRFGQCVFAHPHCCKVCIALATFAYCS